MGEVVGGDAVGLEQNMIHVVFRNGQLALDQIVKLELILDGAGGAEAQHPGVARVQLGPDILHGAVAPDGILAIVAGGLLVCLLLFAHGRQFFLCAEAGIGLTLTDKLLGVNVIDGSSLTLTVGAVNAVVAVHGGTFVKVDAVVLQGLNQHLDGAGDLTLGIGVLHPQEQHTAAAVGHTLGGQTLHQVAKMDKAGGGGRHTGNHGAFGNAAGGIFFFQHLRGVCDIGKQELSKCGIIHSHYLCFDRSLENSIPSAGVKVNFPLRFSCVYGRISEKN